jgi:hypothetical protein
VPADGLLAYVTIDTTGWFSDDGPWDLRLAGTFNGDSNFQSPTGQMIPWITGGAISIRASRLWHNPRYAVDVNGDGIASPLDALQVIVALNAHGALDLTRAPEDLEARLPYVDTNNDGILSPLDALVVISHLNRLTAAEGEGAIIPAPLIEGSAQSGTVDTLGGHQGVGQPACIWTPSAREAPCQRGVTLLEESTYSHDVHGGPDIDHQAVAATDRRVSQGKLPNCTRTASVSANRYDVAVSSLLSEDALVPQGLESALSEIADDVHDAWV